MIRFLSMLVFLLPLHVFAFAPTFVSPIDVDDHPSVEEEGVLYSFYGELEHFPHMYAVDIEESALLQVQILVPDTEGVLPNRSGIIVKQEKRGVSEVARLHYREASWEQTKDTSTGDRYLQGGSFEAEVEPGTYLVEVSTGDNVGKYVLQIQKGETTAASGRGYFATLGDVYRIKKFFEKPVITVLQSPYYYIPTIILLVLGFMFFRRNKKKHA